MACRANERPNESERVTAVYVCVAPGRSERYKIPMLIEPHTVDAFMVQKDKHTANNEANQNVHVYT